MTTVYRAHCRETEEVLEHDTLTILVNHVANSRPTKEFNDFNWYVSTTTTVIGTLVDSTTYSVMKELFSSHRLNKELKNTVKLLTEPAEFESKITMVVDISVDGLNMINQPYNPEYLLELAVTGKYTGVRISNLQVDMETATDMFGDEVNEEYDYEYRELTPKQLDILGIEDFDSEDLVDPDELTDEDLAEVASSLDSLPVSSGGIPTVVRTTRKGTHRPTPRTPKLM